MSLLSRIANMSSRRVASPAKSTRSSSRTLPRPSSRAAIPPRPAARSAPPLRHREESRDVRLIPWLDSLRADAVFGWRQLMKNKVASAAAILSLALAIGACAARFPPHRCAAAAPFARRRTRSGSTRSPARTSISTAKPASVRRLGLSVFPADARRRERIRPN